MAGSWQRHRRLHREARLPRRAGDRHGGRDRRGRHQFPDRRHRGDHRPASEVLDDTALPESTRPKSSGSGGCPASLGSVPYGLRSGSSGACSWPAPCWCCSSSSWRSLRRDRPVRVQPDSANGVDFQTLAPPSAQHWFGTTVSGDRRVLPGRLRRPDGARGRRPGRRCLSIVVGVPLGLLSGYRGGWVDRVLVLITDALFVFPTLAPRDRHFDRYRQRAEQRDGRNPFGGSRHHGRLRAAVLPGRSQRDGGRARGALRRSGPRTRRPAARRHGVATSSPMSCRPCRSSRRSTPATRSSTLAGLGFLGFGIEPSSAAEWGYDLNKALSDTAAGIWWTGLFPGLAIVLIVLGVTLVGESLNDVLNPAAADDQAAPCGAARRRPEAAASS